jgi:hypothetical protein
MADTHGRGDWIRTSDLLHPKQPRYQAALRPVTVGDPFATPARRLQRSAAGCA